VLVDATETPCERPKKNSGNGTAEEKTAHDESASAGRQNGKICE
jgi:hypothetical protein